MRFIIFSLILFSLLDGNELKQCITCHPKITAFWQQSHHAKSMQLPTSKTVLGDFNNTSFSYLGIKTTFYKKKGSYFIKTDNENGEMQEYKVVYTFGVTPLQQYLLQVDKGKLQALDIAWDTKKKRWFHLHSDQNVTYTSPLHWSKLQLNWNYMCADCHSTGVKKNYDYSTKTYHTTFESLNVTCKACHGDATKHLLWTKNHTIPDKGFMQPISRGNEVDRCIKCHSRRYALNDTYKTGDPIADHYRVATLDRVLYFDDGSMQDEVFVYGSYSQSKMFQNGVVCSDCHNVHSTKKPTQEVCAKCHERETYFTSKHHHHTTEAVTCISCHMPPRTYMKIDVRNDHAFSIPNPAISQQDPNINNACNLCHADKNATWSVQAMERWGQHTRKNYFFEAAVATREEKQNGFKTLKSFLDRSVPSIQKATLLPNLGIYPSFESFKLAQKFLQSEHVMVEKGALKAMEAFGAKESIDAIFEKLNSPVLDIRIEAAKYLTPYLGANNMAPARKKELEKVIQEYEEVLYFNSDRAESLLELALLEQNRSHFTKAEHFYKEAMALEPYLVSTYVNYAHFLSAQSKHSEAIQILKKGLKKLPSSAWLYHTLGLEYININQKKKALRFLQKAYELNRNNIRFGYVYAVALSEQKKKKSVTILQKLYAKHPANRMLQNAIKIYEAQIQRRKQ